MRIISDDRLAVRGNQNTQNRLVCEQAPVLVGTNTITAKYSGDADNQASQTKGSINEVITGTAQILVSGTTSNIMHNTLYTATIQ